MAQIFELPSSKMLRMLKTHGDPKSDKESVIWFVAYHTARSFCDCNTTKDWAHMFRSGIKPTEETLEDDIVTMFDGFTEHALIGMILDFYGKS